MKEYQDILFPGIWQFPMNLKQYFLHQPELELSPVLKN